MQEKDNKKKDDRVKEKEVNHVNISSMLSPFFIIELKNETVPFIIKEDQIRFQD